MAKQSAGVLLFRRGPTGPLFLLVKPGGPFYAHRGNDPVWGIPKGEFDPEAETPPEAAEREFREELGPDAPVLSGLLPLGTVKVGSKTIHGFAAQGNFDTTRLQSNTFELEWPRGSGNVTAYPEVDRAVWLEYDELAVFMHPAQLAFVDRLLSQL